MMKKLSFVISVLLFTAPAFAQATLNEGYTNRVLQQTIERALHNAFSHPDLVPWVQAVRSEERQAQRNGPLGASVYGLKQGNYNEQKPAPADSARFIQRLRACNFALETNPALKTYHFSAPRPADLVNLTHTQLTFLASFFNEPVQQNLSKKIYAPKEITHPYEAVTQLKFQNGGNDLFLVINSRTKKVYFFAHNVPGAQAY